jgi:hypothetical protein
MTIVGVVLLYLLTILTEPFNVRAIDITRDMIGQNVKLTGNVKSYFMNKGNLFMTIGDDYNEMRVVFFSQYVKQNQL